MITHTVFTPKGYVPRHPDPAEGVPAPAAPASRGRSEQPRAVSQRPATAYYGKNVLQQTQDERLNGLRDRILGVRPFLSMEDLANIPARAPTPVPQGRSSVGSLPKTRASFANLDSQTSFSPNSPLEEDRSPGDSAKKGSFSSSTSLDDFDFGK